MKRVKCLAKVTEVLIELPGGEEWVFAMDMAAFALMIEDGQDLSALLEKFQQKPVSSLAEVLYYGLKERQPDLTLSDIRRRVPPSAQLIEAVIDAISDAIPEGDPNANPMRPPVRRRKTGRAG